MILWLRCSDAEACLALCGIDLRNSWWLGWSCVSPETILGLFFHCSFQLNHLCFVNVFFFFLVLSHCGLLCRLKDNTSFSTLMSERWLCPALPLHGTISPLGCCQLGHLYLQRVAIRPHWNLPLSASSVWCGDCSPGASWVCWDAWKVFKPAVLARRRGVEESLSTISICRQVWTLDHNFFMLIGVHSGSSRFLTEIWIIQLNPLNPSVLPPNGYGLGG